MINTSLLNAGYFENNSIDSECKSYSNDSEKRKVNACVDGFSYGKANPVPVSEISIYEKEIRFTNGMTRFSWLIAAGAYIIPVECDKSSVKEILELYGQDDIPALSVDEYYLIKNKNGNGA